MSYLSFSYHASSVLPIYPCINLRFREGYIFLPIPGIVFARLRVTKSNQRKGSDRRADIRIRRVVVVRITVVVHITRVRRRGAILNKI